VIYFRKSSGSLAIRRDPSRIVASHLPDKREAVSAILLVGFVRGRDDTANLRSFMQLRLNPLRFFLHSNPSKFADEMKNFHRRTFLVVCSGDFSTLQIGGAELQRDN